MRLAILLSVFCLFFIGNLQTQPNWSCETMVPFGLNPSYDSDQFGGSPRDDIFVPIVFHIVSDSEGFNTVDVEDLYDAICYTNQLFDGSGMQFYVLDVTSEINDSAVLEDPMNHNDLFLLNKQASTINVFVGAISPLAATGYYVFGADYLVLSSLMVNASSTLLPHELGHHFKLLHTYHSWSAGAISPFEPPAFFDPTGMEPASELTDIGVPAELVDGSNCEMTGDRICDTPPDYAFGFLFHAVRTKCHGSRCQ